MAEKEAKNEPTESSGTKRGLSIKLVAVIAGLMIIEAGAVVGVLSLTMPSAADAGVESGKLAVDEGEQTQELMVVADKFQNLRSGRVWQWEVEVWLKVKTKHVDQVKARLERRQAEIKQAINLIISKAQHDHLKEPEHQTLMRQLNKTMAEFFSTDSGELLFEDVLLPKVRGNPTDF